jgi:taurine dioxygenase
MSTTATSITVEPTGGPLGAEVLGVDLALEQDGEAVFAILEAFRRHHVLLFRDQQVTAERQLEIAEWFGPRYVPPDDLPVLGDASQPPVVAVSNAPGGVLGEDALGAHSDLQYMPIPLLGSMLVAEEIPSAGGDTSWSNLHLAYDELGAELREAIDDRRAWAFNPYAGPRALRSLAGPNQRYAEEEVEPFFHPLVRTHPDTGRRSLYVSWLTAGIEGVPEDESRDLLAALIGHVDDDRFYWTHRWRPGDVVVWDNRCTNHKRTGFDSAERRVLHRVQIAGTRPF